MAKNDPGIILEKLRGSLAFASPELHDVYWGVAKLDLHRIFTQNSAKGKFVKTGVVCLITGASLGVAGTRYIPKTQVIKTMKYIKEAFMGMTRLQKIAIEESYRLDEAIETEEKFLEMMQPESLRGVVDFNYEVKDLDGVKRVSMNFERAKKKKDKNDTEDRDE